MKYSTLAKAITGLAGGLAFSGMVMAGVVNDPMSRISADAASGSGHTVRNECGGGEEGWDGATARLKITQVQGTSLAEISVADAKPDTLYTVWLRVKGKDVDGNNFGGSPLTGGGATPLAPGSDLDGLIEISPWNSPGSPTLANGFDTDGTGHGKLTIALDFPVIGGAYPFGAATLPTPSGPGIPTAIVNPNDPGVGGPFMIRVVSHCQDGLGHGLSPGKREAWFQWP